MEVLFTRLKRKAFLYYKEINISSNFSEVTCIFCLLVIVQFCLAIIILKKKVIKLSNLIPYTTFIL